MIIEDLATYLQVNNIATLGTNMFISNMPPTLNNIIMLTYQLSPTPNPSIKYYTQYIDVWTRYSKEIDGYNKLISIQELLHTKANYTMGNWHIYISASLGSIEDLDRDIENRKLQKLTLSFTYRDNT